MDEIISFSGWTAESIGADIEDIAKGGLAFNYVFDRYASENQLKVMHVALTRKERVSSIKRGLTQYVLIPKRKYSILLSYLIRHRKNVKVLQINTFPKPWIELPLVILAKLLGIEIVDFMFNVYDFKNFGFAGRLIDIYYRYLYYSLVHGVFVNTKYLKKSLKFIKKPIYIFPQGVDINQFKPSSEKPRHDKLVILFVGLISHLKRVEDIIMAISDPEIKGKVVFWVVGRVVDKEFFDKIKKELGENKIDHKIFGYIPHNELPKIYTNADVFVNMRPDETFANVFVEALSCGVPIIGRKGSPGPEEIIENGKNGYLVKDVEELKDVLQNLVKNRDALKAMSIYCRKFVEQNYTYEHTYAVFKSAYDRFMENSKGISVVAK